MIIPNIVEQHAEEAAFLWLQRNDAINAPHYSLQDLVDLDDRLEAHIDGLRVAGEEGWKICLTALEEPDEGAVFVAMLLALESGNVDHVQKVIRVGCQTDEMFHELVCALGWVEAQHMAGLLPRLRMASSVKYKRLAIAASAIRREDPGAALAQELEDSDIFIKARALRAIGELKRRDLAHLLPRYQEDNAYCRFWSAWSGAVLGNHEYLPVLQHYAESPSKVQMHALQLALRIMDTSKAHIWLRQLAGDDSNLRLAIKGIGILGDPMYVPTLISYMAQPPMARIAGESFSMITGVDIAYEDLEGEWPEGFEAGPDDDPENPDVAMDEDEDLPWPDILDIGDWWASHQGQFQKGQRYLLGKPISQQSCRDALKHGMQRQRKAAAIELALLSANEPLFNVAAPGLLQRLKL